jgi:phage regulator Rha-like protein
MSELSVSSHSDGALVVDSRLVAEELGVNHSDWLSNIVQKYKTYTEQAFGILRFENGEIIGRGQPEKFVWLTEDQALFLTTLSRNTPNAVRCKALIIAEFSKARKLLKERGYYQIPHTSVYIRRLEDARDHIIADHLWCVFQEGARVLLRVEKDFRVPIEQMDLCDGSIGTHWKNYRKQKEWVGQIESYTHVFRDQRGKHPANAYQFTELPHFRKWLREEYETIHLPVYLSDKYGKRATLQIYQEQNLVDDYILSITEEKKKSKKQDELYEIFLAAREALENRLLMG